MKKKIISLGVGIAMMLGMAAQANAIIVFDPTAQTTRVVQLAKEAFSAVKDAITAYSTSYLQLKASVLDPIGNGMIAVSLLKQQNNTINLVTGALGGGNSLLKSDPQKWINDQGLNVVQVSLSDLSGAKGVFSDSLFGNLVSTFKSQNTPLQTKIDQASQSSIPSIVQNNLCSDEQLTAIAKGDVENSDGTYDPAALTARKQEIYNSLCTGDPATNPQLAQKLQQVNNQRPDIGGWDSWLALVNGDNGYTKSVTLANDVRQKAEEAKTAASNDLANGNGVASPRTCNQTVQNAANGDPVLNISDALCRSFSLTNSSGAVNSEFQNALNSGMDRLKSSFGADILSTLSALLSARNTLNVLGNAFTSAGGGSGGSNSSNTNSSVSLTPDLQNNPDAKASLVNSINDAISAYLSTLDSLTQTDNKIISEVNTGVANLDTMNSCYQNLINNSSSGYTASSPSVAPALNYYASQTTYLEGIRASVSQDQADITSAKNYISQIQTTIQNSNSSGEINNAYATFQEKTTNGTFPGDSISSSREQTYLQLQQYNQDYAGSTGQPYGYYQQCQSLSGQTTSQ